MNRGPFPHGGRIWAIGFALSLAAPARAEEPPVETEAVAPAPAPALSVETEGVTPAPEPAPPPEITVAGTRIGRTAGAAHVINARTLERYKYDDPHAILQTVPGVYVRTEDGMGLRPNIGMRGAASDRSKKVTLMEDGVLVAPAPYSAPAAYYFPLMSRMTQVRVVKGPGAVAYGPQTIGGAIDLVSRPIPSDEGGQVDVTVGEYAYGKVQGHIGAQTDRMGFLLEGVHLRTDGFKELPGGEDTGFYRNEWVAKATYDLAPTSPFRHEIAFKGMFSNELSNESYLGLTDADFRANPHQRYAASKLDQMRWHRTSFAFTHRIEPLRKLKIESTVYRNDLSRAWRKVNAFEGAALYDVLSRPDDPSNAIFVALLRGEIDSSSAAETLLIGPNSRDFVSEGIQTRVNYEARTGPVTHRLEYGFRLHHDRVERKHTEDGFSVAGGDVVPTGAPTRTTAWNEAWTEAVAFHAVNAMTLGGLTVTPGARVELMRSALVDRLAATEQRAAARAVLPGVGVYYAFTEAFGALGGVYRGFSPPSPGDAASEPELSVNYEAGFRYTGDPASAQLVGFYNDYSNLTDICTQSNRCLNAALDRQYDAGSARIYGLEAQAAHDVPVGAGLTLPLSAAYTLTLTEFRQDYESEESIFGNVQSGDEMPYVPRHQAHVSAGIQAKRAGAYAAVSYIGAMREEPGTGPVTDVLHTDEQLTVDAGASLRATSFLELYTNVRNLFDAEYLVSRRPFGARANAPRWLQVGVKARF